MKKILSFLGLSTRSTELNLLSQIDNLKKEKESLDLILAKQEDCGLFVPEMTYQEYIIGKETQKNGFFDSKLHSAYYDVYHQNQHEAFKVRKLCKEPHLLHAFLLEFSSFDWESVRAYMAEVNWTWGRTHGVTPTIEQLKECVITLIPEDGYEHLTNKHSSGGFEVSLFYKGNEAICKIWFDKKLAYC